MRRLITLLSVLACLISCGGYGLAQDESVNPGINDSFRDPDPDEFLGKFEVESREVFAHRRAIVEACQIQPGQTVADIGAGTGLFTRLFSGKVGPEGRVIAVDIAQRFLDHILVTSREAGLLNVETLLCQSDSTALVPESVDVVFLCDTYHHFEFPHKTMASMYSALKPGGKLILIDFRRVEGTSTDWVLKHVRAGQEVFEQEIVQAGLKKVRTEEEPLQENYFVVFEKPAPAVVTAPAAPALEFPIISLHGGVLPRPQAVEQPQVGAKVVFDVKLASQPKEVNPGLDRIARLLNLYGAAGRTAQDVKITVVLHGEATKSVLNHTAYEARFQVAENPNLVLIHELQQASVEVQVCGQALNYQGFPDSDVAEGIPIAAAALTVVINKQTDGYSYVPIP